MFFSVAQCFHCKSRSRSIFLPQAPRCLPFISLFISWPLTAFAELISTENMFFLFTPAGPLVNVPFLRLWTIVLPVPLHQRRTGQSRVQIHPSLFGPALHCFAVNKLSAPCGTSLQHSRLGPSPGLSAAECS
jgi:hypothetical protein